MENSIFRKSSLERISSPEQLNEYVRIINPGLWLILGGFFALVIAVGVWVFCGTIPETVQLNGVAFAAPTGEQNVYCYVSLSLSKRLNEGMKVQISPDYAPREEYGYIFGTVERIGKTPVTERELQQTFGSVQYVQGLLPQGNVVEIKIAPEQAGANLVWSNQKGRGVEVTNGSNCNVLIVTQERKPYELILNQ